MSGCPVIPALRSAATPRPVTFRVRPVCVHGVPALDRHHRARGLESRAPTPVPPPPRSSTALPPPAGPRTIAAVRFFCRFCAESEHLDKDHAAVLRTPMKRERCPTCSTSPNTAAGRRADAAVRHHVAGSHLEAGYVAGGDVGFHRNRLLGAPGPGRLSAPSILFTALAGSSCSQIRMTVQPSSASSAVVRRSRSSFDRSFGTQ